MLLWHELIASDNTCLRLEIGMCGIAGMYDLRGVRPVDQAVLTAMARTLRHRGPDDEGSCIRPGLGFAFRRLSIIDLAGGAQPMANEDGSLLLVANGEIFNEPELRRELVQRSHVFSTACDVEVLLHLYEEHGRELFSRLNGQYGFALYDSGRDELLLGRDPVGVCPLYFAEIDGWLVFASEIKAILAHPAARAEVDLTGLDQVLCLPGLVSPRTIFRGISSLKPGHGLLARRDGYQSFEFWDLDYPLASEPLEPRREEEWIEDLAGALERAVERRLRSDVEVGFYLSGGLDSSLIAALVHRLRAAERRHSFSICFGDRAMTEEPYQLLMADRVGSIHHAIDFDWKEISSRFERMIWHCECPVKETYNTCSMALAEASRQVGVPVILTGEGADELFAGYVGYRFDQAGQRGRDDDDLETMLEKDLRERMFGDRELFYEVDQLQFANLKRALYAPELRQASIEFDCCEHELVNRERLVGRHPLHQRSYLDFKLRLSDHLLADHGDRMAMSASVEARYPFLDPEVIALATRMPPGLKLHGLTEKYVVKRMAATLLPREVIEREKFGFHAPGTPYLLQQKVPWVWDLLSTQSIRAGGYFDADAVERLKLRYAEPGFRLSLPFEIDLLAVVLSFEVLRQVFHLPAHT